MNRVYSSLKLHHPLWSEIWTKKVIKRHLEANDPRKGKNSSSKFKLQKKPGKMGNYGKKKGDVRSDSVGHLTTFLKIEHACDDFWTSVKNFAPSPKLCVNWYQQNIARHNLVTG